MDSSKNASKNISIPVLVVLYDFRYMWKDNREISVKKGEKLILLEKTNNDWWQVVRPTERKSFFVPAQYVELVEKEKKVTDLPSSSLGTNSDDSVLYENLNSFKPQAELPCVSNICKSDVISNKCSKGVKEANKLSEDAGKHKPVPKIRTKVTVGKSENKILETIKSDAKKSNVQNTDSKFDKGDKTNISEKRTQDFILSLPKELNESIAFQCDKSYRENSAPVAVENLVYCNVSLEKDKNFMSWQKVKYSDIPNKIAIDAGKNRMKNSYNLKPQTAKKIEVQKPVNAGRKEVKQCVPSLEKDKFKFNQNFSKSLEKLADEIQFEPKKVNVGAKSCVDNVTKSKLAKMPKDNLEKKTDKKGKTNDAALVLDENRMEPQSRSVFSRFRRSLHHNSSFKSNNLKKLGKNSKKACELSLSWEGGLDKIQEKKESKEKLEVTPLGLQRSRTFMFAERSPLSSRPANKIFSGKHRLDTAYHSQRKPEEKVTLSTFKPIFNLDITRRSPDFAKKTLAKEPISQGNLKKEKLQRNYSDQTKDKFGETILEVKNERESKHEGTKTIKLTSGENIAKVYQNVPTESEINFQSSRKKGFAFYSEPYSNSESEDNLEEKSLELLANKTLKSQSFIESNVTVSEGTDFSESDDNESLDFKLEKPQLSSKQLVNKRRTSLVRNSRVESSRVRKVTARLPPTPPSEQKPLKELGEGWGSYISKGGRNFYYNKITGEKNWKPPRRTLNAQEKRLVGSHESVYSDVNRSDTSSPLNENCHLSNSLNRSNASLHSKSGNLETLSFETSKSGSIPRWKEDSPDDLNRSSCNSSPVTGLSHSSTYSLNKSSRDSLNRFSPIENIPSEEEGFELHDHIYQNDISTNEIENRIKLEDENKGKGFERGTSGFCVKPGWDEFYDESSDQIYYMYKDRKEKWLLSFDSEERAYFFEETSKKSLWALPDYSREDTKSDCNYLIQKSATESAINNDSSLKLRINKDGGTGKRISASTRSSKTQSMLIEPKFDVSSKDGSKTYSMPRDLSKIYGEIIRFGILNKTKITEYGKKLRKNWSIAFAVLTESYLFFFKDAKSFQNMKNVISPNLNQMCLSLQGAVIEKGDKISSRKNVYKITSLDNFEILIQTDKSSEAEEWFKEINSVIQNLPLEVPVISGSPSVNLNSPPKVGRTKSLKDKRESNKFRRNIKHPMSLHDFDVELQKRSIAGWPSYRITLNLEETFLPLKEKCLKGKETGSMEDLSFTPEERQNKIRARLKKFFIRRPTVDSLKKKGIWKDEPVFGCSLEQITKNRNPRVPIFVEKCIECIESKEENMKTDGLYRASGNLSQVQKIRLEVDQNNLNIMKEEEDVHVLTGSLKLFFRELKEPLIPSKQLEPALLATDKPLRKERIKDFQKIVKSLPTSNYDTLKFLLQHLLRVKEYHKFNRMNINNLAIVFGPTLMWPEQESANMALELMQQNVVIECLLKEFYEIFT